MNSEAVGQAHDFLTAVTREEFAEGHMKDTPKRFTNMLRELTTPDNFTFTVFDNDKGIDEMVIVSDIPFYTLCAHHVIPFFGVCHIAYIPGSYIAGLSKFARAVKYHCRGLNVQEDLTDNIAEFIADKLVDAPGIAVIMKGEHLCMTMRGVQTPGAKTTTSSMTGVFLDHNRQARQEFLSLINGKGH